MTNEKPESFTPKPLRAFIKAVFVLAVIGVLVALVVAVLNAPIVNQLKFNLPLQAQIATMLGIFVAALACVWFLYAAYRWVQSDLKPPRSEDEAALD